MDFIRSAAFPFDGKPKVCLHFLWLYVGLHYSSEVALGNLIYTTAECALSFSLVVYIILHKCITVKKNSRFLIFT